MRQSVISWIKSFYYSFDQSGKHFDLSAYNDDAKFWALGMFIALVVTTYLIWLAARFIIVQILNLVIDRTKTIWDDYNEV